MRRPEGLNQLGLIQYLESVSCLSGVLVPVECRNDHSFFKYHQDDKGTVAVVVNLSPCTITDFHVAGAPAHAVMQGCGKAHILPTKVYHRSGTAPRRCIKLVFFLDLIAPVVVSEEAAGSSSSGVNEEVKEEVKAEVKAEHSSA
jgi:hypothetical protein